MLSPAPKPRESPRALDRNPLCSAQQTLWEHCAGSGEDAVSVVCREPYLQSLLGCPLESLGSS